LFGVLSLMFEELEVEMWLERRFDVEETGAGK
jgi:hypothetical protein